MSKNTDAVDKFLSELREKLQPLYDEEFKAFMEYKKADVSYFYNGSNWQNFPVIAIKYFTLTST